MPDHPIIQPTQPSRDATLGSPSPSTRATAPVPHAPTRNSIFPEPPQAAGAPEPSAPSRMGKASKANGPAIPVNQAGEETGAIHAAVKGVTQMASRAVDGAEQLLHGAGDTLSASYDHIKDRAVALEHRAEGAVGSAMQRSGRYGSSMRRFAAANAPALFVIGTGFAMLRAGMRKQKPRALEAQERAEPRTRRSQPPLASAGLPRRGDLESSRKESPQGGSAIETHDIDVGYPSPR